MPQAHHAAEVTTASPCRRICEHPEPRGRAPMSAQRCGIGAGCTGFPGARIDILASVIPPSTNGETRQIRRSGAPQDTQVNARPPIIPDPRPALTTTSEHASQCMSMHAVKRTLFGRSGRARQISSLGMRSGCGAMPINPSTSDAPMGGPLHPLEQRPGESSWTDARDRLGWQSVRWFGNGLVG